MGKRNLWLERGSERGDELRKCKEGMLLQRSKNDMKGKGCKVKPREEKKQPVLDCRTKLYAFAFRISFFLLLVCFFRSSHFGGAEQEERLPP